MIIPPALRPADRIAILSPASAIDPTLVDSAAEALSQWGFDPIVMPSAKTRLGSYSADAPSRLADLNAALADPSIKAILCSRGGYGAVHLLSHITPRHKWLIGFSDISALHALWATHGICSIHGSMAKHLAHFPPDDPANRALHQILTTGRMPAIPLPEHPLSRPSQPISGQIVGGNLAVLAGLISTPTDIIRPDQILVIEDIAEPIYKVERILWQLRLSGVLPKLKALIVGQFTEYREDKNYTDMYPMIADMVAPYSYPVYFDAPIGHVDSNLPFIHGSEITLLHNEIRPNP